MGSGAYAVYNQFRWLIPRQSRISSQTYQVTLQIRSISSPFFAWRESQTRSEGQLIFYGNRFSKNMHEHTIDGDDSNYWWLTYGNEK